jgi:hypothetical protein
MADRRCDACAYWQPWGQAGLCRFNPPVQIRDVRNDMVERWPPVAPDDWCGQFRAKQGSENAFDMLARGDLDSAKNAWGEHLNSSLEDEF